MTTSSTRRRLAALLRSPVGLRQTMLATEVLQPPIALRRLLPGPRTRPAPRRGDESSVDARAELDGRPPSHP